MLYRKSLAKTDDWIASVIHTSSSKSGGFSTCEKQVVPFLSVVGAIDEKSATNFRRIRGDQLGYKQVESIILKAGEEKIAEREKEPVQVKGLGIVFNDNYLLKVRFLMRQCASTSISVSQVV